MVAHGTFRSAQRDMRFDRAAAYRFSNAEPRPPFLPWAPANGSSAAIAAEQPRGPLQPRVTRPRCAYCP